MLERSALSVETGYCLPVPVPVPVWRHILLVGHNYIFILTQRKSVSAGNLRVHVYCWWLFRADYSIVDGFIRFPLHSADLVENIRTLYIYIYIYIHI